MLAREGLVKKDGGHVVGYDIFTIRALCSSCTSRLILVLPSWQISPKAARSKPSTSITKYAQQGQGFLDPPSFSDSGSLKLRLYTLGKQ